MKTGILVFASMGFLLGCASPADIRSPLLALKGQHLPEVVKRIGIPHNEQKIGGMRIVSYAYAGLSDGNDFYCDIRLVVDDNYVVIDVEIKTNSTYYCPRIDR